ncbi:MAG TPA: protein kinase [Vicinamibacterales bacterium]
MIGEDFGHYTIDARLGSGGMGVVYRAHDTRLQRTVAIKVMGGSSTGSSAAEHSRLLDEARAASALNHPNICTVYEVGEVSGRAFIAMEYVEGQPLGQLVGRDGLPIETVVRYGTQIADALSHAHGRGVIHRDLKTANIVISASGAAKVLDFGLARRVEIRGGDVATQSIEMMESGVLLGTLAYLAPEVLLGQTADVRSDIWSLGVVLYEIATGGVPFKGRNEYDLTSAILRAPVQPFSPHVPPILRPIILRCLAKEPAQRYQQAGEVRAALEAIQSDVAMMPPVVLHDVPAVSKRMAVAAGGALLLIAGIAAWVWWGGRRGPWERTAAEGLLTPIVSTEDQTTDPALSPDGGMVAYVVETHDGRVDLYVGRVKGGARVRLTNDEALEGSPRFSPDGERIAFSRRSASGLEIRVIPALGGDVSATISGATSPAWSPDGKELAYVRRTARGEELTVSGLDGSNARVMLRGDSVHPFLINPAWSPDGRQIAIVRGTGGVGRDIWLVPAEGGPARRAIDEPASVFSDYPVFTPDGRGIVHSSNRGGATNIWFAPLGRGRPLRLTTGAGPDEAPTIAAGGAIAFVNSRWRNLLEAHDLITGTMRTLVVHMPFLWGPSVSPDGREVAFSQGEADGSWHVWSVPFEGGSTRQLASTDEGEVYPRWAPDGSYVLFNTWSEPRRVGRVPAHGGSLAAPTFLTFAGEGTAAFADVSPDGRRIAFSRAESNGEHVYLGAADGGQSTRLTASAAAIPRWSPDGSSIAFAGTRSFSGGISVIRADGTGERRLTPDGGWPVWWPDGKRIGYLAIGRRGDQEIRVVPVDGSGAPHALDGIHLVGTNHPFAVTRDGRTIIVSNAAHLSDEIWLLEPKR